MSVPEVIADALYSNSTVSHKHWELLVKLLSALVGLIVEEYSASSIGLCQAKKDVTAFSLMLPKRPNKSLSGLQMDFFAI